MYNVSVTVLHLERAFVCVVIQATFTCINALDGRVGKNFPWVVLIINYNFTRLLCDLNPREACGCCVLCGGGEGGEVIEEDGECEEGCA
jgi:hypothetical protein